MTTVFVDEVAAGVPMRRKALESALVNLRKVVVNDANGRLRHLEGGGKVVWCAGRHYKYIIVAFNSVMEARAESEFEKMQRFSSGRQVPRVFGFGKLVEDDGVGHPAIIEEYMYDIPLVEAISNSGLEMFEESTLAVG